MDETMEQKFVKELARTIVWLDEDMAQELVTYLIDEGFVTYAILDRMY